MTAVTQFNEAFQKAKKGRSKELRISINLAEDLNTELSSVAIEMVDLQRQVIDLQEKLLKKVVSVAGVTTGDMDGGAF